jgi:hypothetical protein
VKYPTVTSQIAFIFLALVGADAFADEDAENLSVRLSALGDQAVVSFDVSDAFTTDFRKQIKNGLVRRAHIHIEIQDTFGAIRTLIRRCTFKKDVWDEYLQVRVEDGFSNAIVKNKRVIAKSIEYCGRVKSVPLVHLHQLKDAGGYKVKVTVRLNPVSEEERRRARRFMTNPQAQQRNTTRSFFDVIFGTNRNYSNDTFVFISPNLLRPARKP